MIDLHRAYVRHHLSFGHGLQLLPGRRAGPPGGPRGAAISVAGIIARTATPGVMAGLAWTWHRK